MMVLGWLYMSVLSACIEIVSPQHSLASPGMDLVGTGVGSAQACGAGVRIDACVCGVTVDLHGCREASVRENEASYVC